MAPPLTLALDGGYWLASRPGRFTPWEIAPGTHWIWGWMGPIAGLDAVEYRKMSCPCRESNPGRPDSSLVDIPTELSQLPLLLYFGTVKINLFWK
jgi:hypothetical protein